MKHMDISEVKWKMDLVEIGLVCLRIGTGGELL
jgi:hypothetical protein